MWTNDKSIILLYVLLWGLLTFFGHLCWNQQWKKSIKAMTYYEPSLSLSAPKHTDIIIIRYWNNINRNILGLKCQTVPICSTAPETFSIYFLILKERIFNKICSTGPGTYFAGYILKFVYHTMPYLSNCQLCNNWWLCSLGTWLKVSRVNADVCYGKTRRDMCTLTLE